MERMESKHSSWLVMSLYFLKGRSPSDSAHPLSSVFLLSFTSVQSRTTIITEYDLEHQLTTNLFYERVNNVKW